MINLPISNVPSIYSYLFVLCMYWRMKAMNREGLLEMINNPESILKADKKHLRKE